MTGRTVRLATPARRIVSLVPSQTELLADLGLEEEVVGITKFCVHPEPWFRNKMRVGGTKNLHLDRIRELMPDLVLANKEENDRAQVEALAAEFPVWVSDIADIPGALEMIRQVGALTGKVNDAATLVAGILAKAEALKSNHRQARRAAYLIWRQPWMAAGGGTFINAMMELAGLENVLADRERYPVISLSELRAMGTDLVLLSSEPYPFRETHIDELRQELPASAIRLVDGELFSWYGSRMIKALDWLKDVIW